MKNSKPFGSPSPKRSNFSRRRFLKSGAVSGAALALPPAAASLLSSPEARGSAGELPCKVAVDMFDRPDSLFHGHGWESLNPGYWQVKDGALRRRFGNVGERARKTGFPYHYESHQERGEYTTLYDPSLPEGVLWRTDWKLSGNYRVALRGKYLAPALALLEGDDPGWKMYTPGFAYIGIAFGGASLLEGYGLGKQMGVAAWKDDGNFAYLDFGNGKKKAAGKDGDIHKAQAPAMEPGDEFVLTLEVSGDDPDKATMTATFEAKGEKAVLKRREVPRDNGPNGYFGISTRGQIDFEIQSVSIDPQENEALSVAPVECYTCYPLGDTLTKRPDGQWTVKFVSLFAPDGEEAEVRISVEPEPDGGWESIHVAGRAPIVNNDFRRFTSVVTATLPASPAEHTLYYTVWKDGKDVTADTRIGTDSVGEGTAFVGDVPASGSYVGRLPKLTAPYKLCGLSCHAINSGLQQRTGDGELKILGGGREWQYRDQPTVEAYKHFEDYGFQIMVWEDDVWYMELVLYPPSTDDAYKVVTTTICGPTSRWQMMRHWNVINPGDHDYGMDDIKGPEQFILRNHRFLGQDPEYLQRNFQIVHHLITGAEEVDGKANPKKWRAWKMPDRDFTLVILDSRLWRTSQDTDIWDDQGWGEANTLYDRTDPTRALLGEEQFAWLQEVMHTDSSPVICLTGINGIHTIWTGSGNQSKANPMGFDQRDRVVADYAGWVKAGADRVLELLSGRSGVVTVYGDVHNGSIMKNTAHRLVECSFGPIGRSGGRGVIPGFGPKMKDVDGRDLEMYALYHKQYATPDLQPHEEGAPFYWNFLEMEFDPRPADPAMAYRLRNMIDAPTEEPRGGGQLAETASVTGRPITSRLPEIKTLPNADIRFVTTEGRPLRGARSLSDGRVPISGLVDVEAGQTVLVTAYDGEKAKTLTISTMPLS